MSTKTLQIIGLFGAGLVLLALGLWKHGWLEHAPSLEFGSQIEELSIKGEDGSTVQLDGSHWYLLIVDGMKSGHSLFEYLDTLMTNMPAMKDSLVPVVLVDGEIGAVEEFLGSHAFEFRALPLHAFSRQDLRSMGITDHGSRYVLISPELAVEFSSRYLQPNDLRLLVEKHFGEGDASRVARALSVGQRFPDYERRLKSSGVDDPAKGELWIAFTAECVSCILTNRLKDLAAMQEPIRTFADRKALEPRLLFGSSFEVAEVVAKTDALGLDVPLQLATGPLAGIEDPHLRESLHGAPVVVVSTDPSGRVESIQPFHEFRSSLMNSIYGL